MHWEGCGEQWTASTEPVIFGSWRWCRVARVLYECQRERDINGVKDADNVGEWSAFFVTDREMSSIIRVLLDQRRWGGGADWYEYFPRFDYVTNGDSWAPAGRGKGALAPWKCSKVFRALAVTVSTCVLRATTKKVFNFLKKKCPPRKKKSLWRPCGDSDTRFDFGDTVRYGRS